MDNEKKPSIYDDRGTIGSSEELDKYGVWVKSEPQDLTSAMDSKELPAASSIISDESSGTAELDLPDMDELPDFDALQSEMAGSNSGESSSVIFEDSSAEAGFNDDFDLPEIEAEEKNESVSFDFSDIPEIEEAETKEEAGESGSEGFTEVSMDDFIDTLDTETEGIAEKEQKSHTATSFESREDHSRDLSTQLLMKIAEELASIRTELGSLKKEFSGIKAVTQEETEEKGFFGEEDDEKIALTGDELNNILNTADFTEEAGADATAELSEDLNLEGAEDTISSDSFQETKPGLDELQQEFPEPSEIQESEITSSELSSVEESSMPGDLELDINLDETNLEELDSELSASPESEVSEVSALDDFSEINFEEIDTANSLGESESFEITLDDESFPIEEENAGLSETEESLPDFAVEETEELKELRENGAEPMTDAPPPEDSDYLEMDPLAGDILTENEEASGEAIDLSDAVIDEPDLLGEIQDNPLEEPSLEDISISLDMSELEPETDSYSLAEESDVEGIEEQEEEIELPVDDLSDISFADEVTEPGSGEDISLIPEGFVVEADDTHVPLEEIEEDIIPAEDLDILGTESTAADSLIETEEIQDLERAKGDIPTGLQQELKTVLSYLDQLLEALPDDKIEEFAKSEHYDTYKKLFKELGLV